MEDVTSGFKAYARFGIAEEIIKNCNFSKPAPFHYGLLRPRSCSVPPLYMDPEKIKPATIRKIVKGQAREMKPIVFEWARMNPHKIQKVFDRLSGDESFQKHFYGLYQGLRMIYQRLFNKEAIRIKELDDSFLDNIANQLVEEEERAKKSMEMYNSRQVRCEHLRKVLSGKDDEDHTLCLEDLPRLPEWKPRRRGRKRCRSQVRKEGAGKKIKLHVSPDAEAGLIQAQPGEVQAQPGEVQAQPGEIQAQPRELQDQTGKDQIQSGEIRDRSPEKSDEQEYEEVRSVQLVNQSQKEDEEEYADVMVIEIDDEDEGCELSEINDPKPSKQENDE